MASDLISSKSPTRILIIDEDVKLHRFLQDFFPQENTQFTFLHKGSLVLPCLAREKYDIIICSLQFQDFHSFDLLRFLSKDQRQDLVIIVAKSKEDLLQNSKEQAIELGAFDFLIHPFSQEDFTWCLQRALAWKSRFTVFRSPYELSSLHSLFEAISRPNSLDTIFTLMLDLILSECQADVASFALYHESTKQWEEPFRKLGHEASVEEAFQQNKTGQLHFQALAEAYVTQPYVFAHTSFALPYFSTEPQRPHFISLISIPLRSSQRLLGSLNVYSYHYHQPLGEACKRLLLGIAFQASLVLKNFQMQHDLSYQEQQMMKFHHSIDDHLKATVVSFAHALEASDPYTRGHSERVSRYAHILGRGLSLSEKEQEQVTHAALMHDIGKIGIRSDKLNKPGKLTPEERAMFKTHPAKGKRILDPIPSMIDLIPGAFCHHESFDGSGYPQALMGENIPLIGRIVAIADTYDAMTSDRSYRQALTHQDAVDELKRFAGSQFDPKLVPVFIRVFEEYRLQEEESSHEGVARLG